MQGYEASQPLTGMTEKVVGFVTYKTRNVTIKVLSRTEKLLALKFKSEMLQPPYVRGTATRKRTARIAVGKQTPNDDVICVQTCCEEHSSKGCCLSDRSFASDASMPECLLPHRYVISV